MAIEYSFLNRADEDLIRVSDLPVEDGIAIDVRTTGYEVGTDEVVELAIVDLQGVELFRKKVKPQNIEEWHDERASGGIMPADVQESPELFQFEDEIIALFEKASIVVGLHIRFIVEMIEASWVSLPKAELFDLAEQFCASHCARDYPGQPAAVAALEDIAGYYGVECDGVGVDATARTAAACYLKLVEEHARERLGKGAAYWEAYERRLAEAARDDEATQAARRQQEIKALFASAILWLGAAAVFGNLAVQLHIRGFDFGIVAIVIAAGVFFAVKWIQCLLTIRKLRKQDK